MNLLPYLLGATILIPTVARGPTTSFTSAHKVAAQATQLEMQQKVLQYAFGMDKINTIHSTTITLSAYTATKEECDSRPWITADHTPSRIGLVAISADLERDFGFKMGQTIILPPYGVFQIHDRMSTHKRKGTKHPIPITRQIDILHATKKSATLFGVKPNSTLVWFN